MESQDDLIARLESLQFTPELLEAALESTKDENKDDTDRKLALAIRGCFTEGQLCPVDGPNYKKFMTGILNSDLREAAEATHGHKLTEAERDFVAQILAATVGDPKDIDDKTVASMTTSVLSAYVIALSAFKVGLLHGWRAHELALLAEAGATSIAPMTAGMFKKEAATDAVQSHRTCNVLGQPGCLAAPKHGCGQSLGHGGNHICSGCGHSYGNDDVTDVKSDIEALTAALISNVES